MQHAHPHKNEELASVVSLPQPLLTSEASATSSESSVSEGTSNLNHSLSGFSIFPTAGVGSVSAGLTSTGLAVQRQVHLPLTVQRDDTPAVSSTPTPTPATGAPASAAASPISGEDAAIDYEGEAQDYFSQNMETELRTAASVEGVAIGRRAGAFAGRLVRDTCAPFEADQEVDTQVLNNVFALSGGGASVGEGFTGGSRGQSEAWTPSNSANIFSRVARLAMGVIQANLPSWAGYRTVGSLRDAAVRSMTEDANRAGETTSPSYQGYETAVMDAMHEKWDEDIATAKTRIQNHENPAVALSIHRAFLPQKRTEYLNLLRNQLGAASAYGGFVEVVINAALEPKLEELRQHLQAAKESRENGQAWAAVGAATAGGAAIGAGIGVWGFGVGALPGALIGGAVGLVGGIGAAGRIKGWW